MSDQGSLIERQEVLKTTRSVEFGALKTRERGKAVANLFEETIKKNPNLDLVIGPEYAFYKWPQYVDWRDPSTRGKPLVFQEHNGIYFPVGGDKQILTLLDKLVLLARDTQTNLCLGTVCESELIDGVEISHNTAIVIDNKGRVIQLRRKFTGSDTLQTENQTTPDQTVTARAIQSALNSINPVTFTTKSGHAFTSLIAVCAERDDPTYWQVAQQRIKQPVDSILMIVWEGDDLYTQRSQEILEGGPDENWFFAPRIKNTAQRGIISPKGIWLASDIGAAGIFPSEDRQSITSTESTSDYLIAKCQI